MRGRDEKKQTMRNRGGRGTRDETALRDQSEELKGNREKSFPLSSYDMHVIFYISVGIKSGVESVRERARKEEGGEMKILKSDAGNKVGITSILFSLLKLQPYQRSFKQKLN